MVPALLGNLLEIETLYSTLCLINQKQSFVFLISPLGDWDTGLNEITCLGSSLLSQIILAISEDINKRHKF